MQGSTYERVIVNMNDMLQAPIANNEICSLIYTAMTRASDLATMICK